MHTYVYGLVLELIDKICCRFFPRILTMGHTAGDFGVYRTCTCQHRTHFNAIPTGTVCYGCNMIMLSFFLVLLCRLFIS
jgi:hypothetical protein